MTQASLFPVPSFRREAAQSAAEHADRATGDDWQARAADALMRFARLALGTGEFKAEEALAFALGSGLPAPPDKRAWGAVVQSAAHAGRLTRVGYERDKFGSPKAVWKAVAS